MKSDLLKEKRHKKAALLWDESFLWGIMAYKALNASHIAFDLIQAKDVKEGRLDDYSVLFVPGGWASNKLNALGDAGINKIKDYVNAGGSYLGICGGAGLATLDCIGLLDISRRPTKERVPSFSGRIRLSISGHPLWDGINEPVFHAWWPSQFAIKDSRIKILATYKNAMPDAFSSDLNAGDAGLNGRWDWLEALYQINLDPARLIDEPAVVEGEYGKGRVILSLIHFDTPDDPNGAEVLRNLLKYLGDVSDIHTDGKAFQPAKRHKGSPHTLGLVSEIDASVADLIDVGIRNFLWFWRNPMLLQWRRGVRGLEYCTLYVMIKELSAFSSQLSAEDKEKLEEIKKLLLPFVDKAKRLLTMERFAMQNSHITYEKCDDPEIQKIRNELFGNSKSYGGMFKKLADRIDGFLYSLITDNKGIQPLPAEIKGRLS